MQYNKCAMINELNCNTEFKDMNYDSQKIINMSPSYFKYTRSDRIILRKAYIVESIDPALTNLQSCI